MITKEEIKAIGERLDARRDDLEKRLSGDDDRIKRIAALTNTDGWNDIENAFDEMIFALLEPTPYDGRTAEAYAIESLAKSVGIEFLRQVLESVKSAAKTQEAIIRNTTE